MRTSKDGKLLYNNKSSIALLDYWGSHTTRRLPENYLKIALDVLHSGLNTVVEVDCGNCVFALTFAPIIERGYVNIYGLDISEKIKIQEEVIRLERLKSIGELAAGLSHEINNPINIVNIFHIIDGKMFNHDTIFINEVR